MTAFLQAPDGPNNPNFTSLPTDVQAITYQAWLEKQRIQQRPTIYEIFKNTDFSNAPPPSNASYWGFEGLYGVKGVGATTVTCCDKDKTKHTFEYTKVCYGIGVALGATFGEIKGMETCDKKDYEGWFLEIGGSAAFLSAGIDLSFQNSTINVPLIDLPAPNIIKLGKVTEVGIGGGPGKGVGGKIMFCYYTLHPDIEPKEEKCGCQNVPHVE